MKATLILDPSFYQDLMKGMLKAYVIANPIEALREIKLFQDRLRERVLELQRR